MFEVMDQVVGEALEGAATGRWRWLRIVATALLAVMALGLLTISLWWPR